MNYKIIFYIGSAMTAVTFISTIVAFFKCNVIEIICDLLGIKLQKKVKIKRKGSNKKSKVVNTTVKIKKKDEVKIRSKAEIEEGQSTKSYYVGPRKRNTGRLKDTDIIKKDELIEDTGIIEAEDTDIIDNEETSMMDVEETSMMNAEETSFMEEEAGIIEGEDDTCLIDNENNIEEEETSLLEDEDETSLLGTEEEEEDETCLLGEEENKDIEDGFSEKFIKELEVIVINSNTII